MGRYAQILDNKVCKVFEVEETVKQMYEKLAPGMVFVDVTNNPNVQEGWGYDGVNFSELQPLTLVELKQYKLNRLKGYVAQDVIYYKAPLYKQTNIGMDLCDVVTTEGVKKWIEAVRQAVTEVEGNIAAALTESELEGVVFDFESIRVRAEQIEVVL